MNAADAPRRNSGAYCYGAYGLAIESDFRLPGMTIAAAAIGANRVGFHRLPHMSILRAPFSYDDDGDRQVLSWSEVGTFTISAADTVDVLPNLRATDDLVSLPLLGAVTAALLHRRGTYVLHGSAVSVGAIGVVFVGDKGAGKSTTSALLLESGHTLLADDIAALDLGRDQPHVLPAGSTEMKLWPQSVSVLQALDLGPGRAWHHEVSKASYKLGAPVATDPVPIGAIYVLSRGAEAMITPIQGPDSVAALLRFSYQARYGQAGFGTRLAEHFAQSATLAGQGLVRHLVVPDTLERAHEIVARIEGDLGQSGR